MLLICETPILTFGHVCNRIAHMSNVNADFGHKAEQIIHDKGMTKRAVSEKSGIPYSSLNSTLRGYRAVTLEFIIALAEAVGVIPSELLPPQFAPKALADREVRDEHDDR